MSTATSVSSLPRVVVIGGGFGGLYAAKALGDAPVQVTIIDRQNYHLFQPLLYQVATAALSPADVAYPIRSILRKQVNTTTQLAEVTDIDLLNNQVILTDGVVPFDYLILATGASHSYFGHEEWAPFASGLKDIDDALKMRRQIFLAFEEAERETDPEKRAALLTFVVVGGGATGVELAGALGEIARETLTREFRTIDPGQTRIVLVDSGDRVLRSYVPQLSKSATDQLTRRGVEVMTEHRVVAINGDGVRLQDGTFIAARTVLWAAGVVASPLGKTLGAPLDSAGRVLVNPDLSIPGHQNVFVIGDLANLAGSNGEPLPGVAQVAIQGGKTTAANIKRLVRGEPARPFHYRDYGEMATIGRNAAVAEIGPLKLTGFLGWSSWLFIHLFWLIGFRRRLLVMLQWAWTYVTHSRGARLITMRQLNLDRARQEEVAGIAP